MELPVPELSLIVLIGPSGAGKSTFAAAHFAPTEVLSSDAFRGMIADDAADQSASHGAFDLLHRACHHRLARGRLTVIDATNVRADARKPLLELARRHNVPAVAVVLNVPADRCFARNQTRPHRQVGEGVVLRHEHDLEASLAKLDGEGFRRVYVLDGEEAVDAAWFVRVPLAVNRRADTGPFDIIGDVHGCADELRLLLAKLGYAADADGVLLPPEGRTAVFVGDLVDRGPDVPGVLRIAMGLAAAGRGLGVVGNHDDKCYRWLRGNDVALTHGLDATAAQLDRELPAFKTRVRDYLGELPSHLVLDGGKLVVAHAGLPEELHGRISGRVKAFCLYGDPTGELDADGLPVRRDWAAAYKGKATVVYGHVPTVVALWRNRTICLDTGCVFGGSLTALRYPEQELVSVPAARAYVSPRTPPAPPDGPSEVAITRFQ